MTATPDLAHFVAGSERLLAGKMVVNIVLLDLDGTPGDEVLREVKMVLLRHTRAEDIVARFGEHGFVIAIPQVDVATVERIAERLMQAAATRMSAGIASSRLLEQPSLAQLIDAADRDLYKNKWIREHPDLRPELYEYPAHERNVVERFLRAGAPELPKVLVVEDDKSIRRLLSATLRREGLDVEVAGDGLQALRLCERCEYAVILLDLMMPVMDGFQFLEAFSRATPAARSVIFVTTAFDDRVAGSIASPHVHAIVKKPFDVAQLSALVREVAVAWSGKVRPAAEAAAC